MADEQRLVEYVISARTDKSQVNRPREEGLRKGGL